MTLSSPPAFRHRDFTVFWFGLALSAMGSQFTIVAMAWQIYQLTDSPLQIGLLGLSRALPQMALSLLGGLFADAIDRRKLLAVSQVAQGIIAAWLVMLSSLNIITPEYLFIGSALIAVFTALENPARQAILPNLVPTKDLTSALALNIAQRNLGMVVGPALAGIAIAVSGATWCYGADAISRLALLLATALITPRSALRTGLSGMSAKALGEGFRFVIDNKIILTFMLLDFGAMFFGSARALVPIYARDILDVGPSGMGTLYAAEAVGSVVTGALLSTLPMPRRVGIMVVFGIALYGASTIVFSISHTYWLSIIMLAGSGVGNSLNSVLRGSILQSNTPDELRGRMVGINGIFASGGPFLGQFESGVVADRWGTEISALSGGVATVILAAVTAALPFVRAHNLRPTIPITASSTGR